MNVADLDVHRPDSAGAPVVCIYVRNPPNYAIYRTAVRVVMHFSDDSAKADDQRKAIAPLAPLRGEINGLVDGWRSAPDWKWFWIWPSKQGHKLRSNAERFDRRVADALQVGIEGSPNDANSLLTSVKKDVLDQRIGRARFDYLLMAFGAVVVMIAVSMLTGFGAAHSRCPTEAAWFLCIDHAVHLWRGVAGGALGAFFSIALGIRGRTILPDLYSTSNLMDASLRVTIGAIGGVVLVALVMMKFVQFRFGTATAGDDTALEYFVIGFVAGFTERLVPDLLAKADTSRATGSTATATSSSGAANVGPIGAGAATQETSAAAKNVDVEEVPTEEPGDKDIGADVSVSADEATNDEDLPAASGGVATDPKTS